MKKLLLILIIPFLSFGQDLCEGVTVELNSVTDSTLSIVISTVNSPDFWCSYCGLVLRDNNDSIVAIENPYNGGSFYGLGGGYSELRTLEIINNIDLPFEGELHAMNGLMPNVMVDENLNINPLNPIDMVDGDIPFTMCFWEFNLIEGCADETACNYDPQATKDNGSCTYPGDQCLPGVDCSGSNMQPVIYYLGLLDNDCDCIQIVGCMDPEACNYIPSATSEFGFCEGCLYTGDSITYYTIIDQDPVIITTCEEISEECECCYIEDGYTTDIDDNGDIILVQDYIYVCGCMDENACNYDPNAFLSNNSCLYDDGCSSLQEIFNSKNVLNTIDILGRKTTNIGFQLHVYDDGSVEKKYLIK